MYVTFLAITGLVSTISFSAQLVAILNSYHYTAAVYRFSILDWFASLGAIFNLCKCETDVMAPVEHTKWIASASDCALNHTVA